MFLQRTDNLIYIIFTKKLY